MWKPNRSEPRGGWVMFSNGRSAGRTCFWPGPIVLAITTGCSAVVSQYVTCRLVEVTVFVRPSVSQSVLLSVCATAAVMIVSAIFIQTALIIFLIYLHIFAFVQGGMTASQPATKYKNVCAFSCYYCYCETLQLIKKAKTLPKTSKCAKQVVANQSTN